ncbi:MAG: hypothetical protein RBR09_13270 [Desulfobulbaceae bacterium]|nr:hypothetical protein [Desulfobulbaceae bacterium]
MISGRILIDGKDPMPGGVAAFFDTRSEYPPKFGNLRRIPDHVAKVGPEGRFTAVLPAGSYYLGVIVRDNPEAITGPPGPEEKGFSAVNDEGKRKIFAVAVGQAEVDLGDIYVSTPRDEWKHTDFFTVRGTVIDKTGQPFAEGAWILVNQNPVSRRPNFISGKISGSGQFELHLPPGRPYYLIAKDVLGMGRPQPGRHVGAYTGSEPVFEQNKPEPKPIPLSGGAGEVISDIRILMIEVPDIPSQTQPIRQPPGVDLPGMK